MDLSRPLLGLLAVRRMSGYDIKKWIDEEGRYLGLARHQSQVYRELARMHDAGWVEYEIDPRGGAPDAKLYRITDAGIHSLQDWAASPYQPPLAFQDPEFNLRLRFAGMLGREHALALARVELRARREQVRRRRGQDRAVVPLDPRPEVDLDLLGFTTGSLHIHGAQALDAWIGWLEQLIKTLEIDDDPASA
ncbi:PadR family transcriptional regulator [Jiangella sp. DSM 45060]|uniref:PadR family transcriptional regulator n=1 Tax=Jiangella sp. DSM 45060 TaxID=1798224 RepID=UPI00087CE860|nr:PadR family transcriptional regulator [Jiangella sp. DSM 45060]SDT72276.1 DNA-binding transcriptional regulator, PadR family [Jiangella sp. DSM 45060]